MVATKPLPDSIPRGAEPSDAELEALYPSSDGEPMADNTKQWEWMALLKHNLDELLPDFVASDNLWYPVEGRPDIRLAPDVYVAIGRPKGHRGSYMQWREGGVPLTVVFEVLSPKNTTREMIRKGMFYDRHGAREFIIIDPEDESGWALIRDEASGDRLEVPNLDGWTSPTLGIRFEKHDGRLRVFRPDGMPFVSFHELEAQKNAATERAVHEAERAEREAERAEREAERAEREAERARRLAEKLAALGLDPDAL